MELITAFMDIGKSSFVYFYFNKDLFYFRFQKAFDPTEDTELDSTSRGFLDYMKEAAEAQYDKDRLKISAFIQKLNFGN
jgi:hypothetical protein